VSALARIDSLPEPQALAAFLRCCGSRRWAEAMARGRPYRDETQLLAAAERAFARLSREDWLEAFSHHPRIGERGALAVRFTPGPSGQGSSRQGAGAEVRAAGWSAAEQSGVAGTSEDVLDALARANRDYEARFGYIFIVCATGKSAGEMLALLRERLPNEPDAELALAAAEQRKITAIRLRKLLSEGP
jgi:2-oxo-4-hydroxy-4-carboxy-5-ureidoimidazoline decarboxylase